jgi:hypothetical protein
MAGDQTLERRRKKRLPAKDGCLVTLGSDPIKPWQILDISEEGLAFRYIGGAEEPRALSELDILTCDTSLSIERVPFKLVSDLKMSDPVPQRFQLNRCSVRFGSLTTDQMVRLASFLKNYTAPRDGPRN